MFQFLVSIFINFLLPQSNLALLVILDNLKNILVKFINVFILLSFSDTFT